ncbi:MAG: D-aminoacyl-tRNA deacylase [Acidimicrobiales bacterium]
MRAVVQRVSRAEVRVAGAEVGRIGPGLCALVGVTHGDGAGEADRLATKIWNLRILADGSGVMNRSLAQVAAAGGRADVLVVSQFTLYGDTSRGRRPSWVGAAPPEVAEPLVDRVVAALEQAGATTATGRFGADMDLELINDGPVTLVIDVPPAGSG